MTVTVFRYFDDFYDNLCLFPAHGSEHKSIIYKMSVDPGALMNADP